jgi:hypothetical protein
MKKKKVIYRQRNYRASKNRVDVGIVIHPDLLHGLKEIAKYERKSVCWLVETALSDYFGVEVMLRKSKTQPRPEYSSTTRR